MWNDSKWTLRVNPSLPSYSEIFVPLWQKSPAFSIQVLLSNLFQLLCLLWYSLAFFKISNIVLKWIKTGIFLKALSHLLQRSSCHINRLAHLPINLEKYFICFECFVLRIVQLKTSHVFMTLKIGFYPIIITR